MTGIAFEAISMVVKTFREEEQRFNILREVRT
jgi:hypothetical protein